MMRVLHRWPGLLALVLLFVITLSGAALSVFPSLEAISAPSSESGLSVAELASRVQAHHPGLEQIRRAPSGRVTAWWFDGGSPGSAVIDPATGLDVASADPGAVQRWITTLHRSLFLDDTGRLIAAGGAVIMLLMALSGASLVARRTGGWRRWFAPLRGPLSGRLHSEIARVAVLGLIVSSTTALWMSAETFDVIQIDSPRLPSATAVSGLPALPLDAVPVFTQTPASMLRDLRFPYPDDLNDTFTLKTEAGQGSIDQGTGEVLAWVDLTFWQQVSEFVFMIHTGQGAAVIGLILGLAALSVPILGATGGIVWWAGRRGRPRIRDNQPAGRASTVILVGSEGGTTWGFAVILQKALVVAGHSVHVGPMSSFDPSRFAHAERFILMAATYGDGDAPASAKAFLDRLATLATAPAAPVAILGFGDRSFPEYCTYAEAVRDLADQKGWAQLTPLDTVDRQSPQDFARWGRTLGQTLGQELSLSHQPVLPHAEALTLLSRRDYGAEVQAPAAILRFSLPRLTLWQRLTGQSFARFEAGDLLGILPEGSALPRLYSLGSGSREGFVEIVVRKHPGGLASGQLLALEPGDRVQAFLRRNPRFHAGRGRAPLILIGAGTGIGPLAGIIRANTRRRPVQLFLGMRDPSSDFFYGEDVKGWQADNRLGRIITAVSRSVKPQYVQDAVRAEGHDLAQAIRGGARIMVCGGREMAQGVSDAFEAILAPIGLTPAALKADGRYVEDVY